MNRSLNEKIEVLELEARERSRTPSLHEEGIFGYNSREGINLPLVSLDDEEDLIASVFENENDSGMGSAEQTPGVTPREELETISSPTSSTQSISFRMISMFMTLMVFLFFIYVYICGIHIPNSFYVKVEYDRPPPT